MCFVARKILHGTQTQCLQLMAREEGHLKVKIDSKLTTCYFLTVPSCCHIMGPPPSSVIVIARTSIVPHCHTLPRSATLCHHRAEAPPQLRKKPAVSLYLLLRPSPSGKHGDMRHATCGPVSRITISGPAASRRHVAVSPQTVQTTDKFRIHMFEEGSNEVNIQ